MIGRKISITLPFRYPGGKYYAIKKLRIFWESVFHDEYREPFLGGGSIFWAKDLVQHNWINDIDEDLIRILKFIKTRSNLEDLLNLFVNEKESTRKKYQEIRDLIPETELEKVYK